MAARAPRLLVGSSDWLFDHIEKQSDEMSNDLGWMLQCAMNEEVSKQLWALLAALLKDHSESMRRFRNVPRHNGFQACQTMTAAINEDGDPEEALQPKSTFNPVVQRMYQGIQHRALNPQDPIPELDPLLKNYVEPHKKLWQVASVQGAAVTEGFQLTMVSVSSDHRHRFLRGGKPSVNAWWFTLRRGMPALARRSPLPLPIHTLTLTASPATLSGE